jgi:tetratricopeptide (TPR) repeat protein
MHDPYFEATVADIRGFDLDDDAPVLEALEAEGEETTPPDRLLRAVLRLRADRPDAALFDLEQVAIAGHAVSVARYLQAGILARRSAEGDPKRAEEALARAAAAAERDGLVPTADLSHARGLLAWRAGRLEEALGHVDAGLKADDTAAPRWLDHAILCRELARTEDMRASLARALEIDPELELAQWESAIVQATEGRFSDARESFRRALDQEPSLRARALTDPRLRSIRTRPELARLFETTPASDLRWVARGPEWLRVLATEPELGELGFGFLDIAERERLLTRARRTWTTGPVGTLHTSATLAEAQRRLATVEPVAWGPATRRRDGAEEKSVLWLDDADPTRLWLAPGEAYPPFLWVDAGADVDALAVALAELAPPRGMRREHLPATVRAFLGYAGRIVVPSPYGGELEPAGIAELDRHLSLSPFLEPGAWGSAFADDPWPDQIPPQPGLALKMEARQKEMSAQAPGQPWSSTWRLRHSRAYFTIEAHHDDIFVVEVRYRPAPHERVVAHMNATFGCDFPRDMPLDAIAVLLGFAFDGAGDLEPALERADDPEEIAGLLLVLSALRHSQLDAHALWRAYAGHAEPVVRATVANIALAYNFESLLEERSLLEPDAGLRAEIEAALDEGIGPPGWDPWASHGTGREDPNEEVLP